MPIDLTREPLIALHQAVEIFPKNRKGKKPSLSALYRWTTKGVRGVRLESVQVANVRCTTQAAVFRFIGRLTDANNQIADMPPERCGHNSAAESAGEVLDAVVFDSAAKRDARRSPRATGGTAP